MRRRHNGPQAHWSDSLAYIESKTVNTPQQAAMDKQPQSLAFILPWYVCSHAQMHAWTHTLKHMHMGIHIHTYAHTHTKRLKVH